MRLPTRPLTALVLCAAFLSGCAQLPGSGGAPGQPAPGMNERGEVIDSRQVRAGHGQRVKGEGGWDGEITGKPAPGSKFTQLRIGMSASEAQALLGPPSDFGAQPTLKNFIPFYAGSDRTRYETVYKGQGRLIFASSAGTGDKMHLVWIIHSAQESGTR